MKIHRTENGIHISVDTRESRAREDLVRLRFALNAYGPLVHQVKELDVLIEEFEANRQDKQE